MPSKNDVSFESVQKKTIPSFINFDSEPILATKLFSMNGFNSSLRNLITWVQQFLKAFV